MSYIQRIVKSRKANIVYPVIPIFVFCKKNYYIDIFAKLTYKKSPFIGKSSINICSNKSLTVSHQYV